MLLAWGWTLMLHAQQSKRACLDLIDEVLQAESTCFNGLCKLSAAGLECHACTAAAGSIKACSQSRELFNSCLQSVEAAELPGGPQVLFPSNAGKLGLTCSPVASCRWVSPSTSAQAGAMGTPGGMSPRCTLKTMRRPEGPSHWARLPCFRPQAVVAARGVNCQPEISAVTEWPADSRAGLAGLKLPEQWRRPGAWHCQPEVSAATRGCHHGCSQQSEAPALRWQPAVGSAAQGLCCHRAACATEATVTRWSVPSSGCIRPWLLMQPVLFAVM